MGLLKEPDRAASFPRKFVAGFRAFFQGLRLVRDRRLLSVLIWPSLLSLGLGLGLPAGIYFALRALLARFVADAGSLVQSLVALVAVLTGFFLYFLLYRFFVSLLIAPFLGPLLERMEHIVLGQARPTPNGQDLKNFLLGLRLSIRHTFFALLAWAGTIWLGPLQIGLLILLESYFLGRASVDFLLEKETDTLRERDRLAASLRPQLLGLGMGQLLVLWIPVLGALITPAAGLGGAVCLFHGSGGDPARPTS